MTKLIKGADAVPEDIKSQLGVFGITEKKKKNSAVADANTPTSRAGFCFSPCPSTPSGNIGCKAHAGQGDGEPSPDRSNMIHQP